MRHKRVFANLHSIIDWCPAFSRQAMILAKHQRGYRQRSIIGIKTLSTNGFKIDAIIARGYKLVSIGLLTGFFGDAVT